MAEIPARRWTLAAHPKDLPTTGDFKLETFVPPPPGPDEALVRICFHTVAPGVRAKLAGDTYTAQVGIGDPIPGYGVGIVEASNCAALRAGDRVVGELPWSTHAIVGPGKVEVLDPAIFDDPAVPLETAIGILGASGLTAYFGLLRIGGARAGERILVSSASGAVGSAVGQIARLIGCTPIGLAGSDAKCAELTDSFGFSGAINYRSATDLAEAMQRHAEGGFDLYYDNVGGEILDAAIPAMRFFGRIVVCGQTSDYNRAEARGFRSMTQVVVRRLTLRGFVVHDFAAEFGAARAELAQWLRDGKLLHRATVLDGIEQAAGAFVAQFTGDGPGRPLIKAT